MQPDQQLVERVVEGDPHAANELAERCTPLVRGLAHRRFGLDRHAAEDLAQTTLERLWENDFRALRAWRGEGKITTYVTVIATRLWLRARRRHDVEEARDPATSEVATRAVQLDEIERSEARLALRNTLRELSPRDQLLLRLRFVDDQKPAQIARLLGLSRGATRKALHDALRRLRHRFEKAPDR